MKMIEVKTADLVGAALDWAVGVSMGHKVQHSNNVGGLSIVEPYSKDDRYVWEPSTDWAQGGPLIERYKVVCDYGRPLEEGEQPKWFAQCWNPYAGERGDTPLIAAMRAIVAAKLGDTVSVPADLLTSS